MSGKARPQGVKGVVVMQYGHVSGKARPQGVKGVVLCRARVTRERPAGVYSGTAQAWGYGLCSRGCGYAVWALKYSTGLGLWVMQ